MNAEKTAKRIEQQNFCKKKTEKTVKSSKKQLQFLLYGRLKEEDAHGDLEWVKREELISM